MNVLLLFTIGLTFGALLWLALQRRRPKPAASSTASARVRVIADAVLPARDLAATLPRRNAELRARIDRHFGYESARRPSYRADVNEELAARLRPVQVVRVKSEAERNAIREQAPKHLRLVFLMEDDPKAKVTVSLPRPRPDRS